jgi:hypothetical protein
VEGLPDPLPRPLADHSPVRYAQYFGNGTGDGGYGLTNS